MRDLLADVLLGAVLPVVPVQVVGVDVRLRGGESHAARVALDARVQLGHHTVVPPAKANTRQGLKTTSRPTFSTNEQVLHGSMLIPIFIKRGLYLYYQETHTHRQTHSIYASEKDLHKLSNTITWKEH